MGSLHFPPKLNLYQIDKIKSFWLHLPRNKTKKKIAVCTQRGFICIRLYLFYGVKLGKSLLFREHRRMIGSTTVTVVPRVGIPYLDKSL